MVTQCSLLFMHKIVPLFAFIYIKRLLGTLEKSRKTQKKLMYSPPSGDLCVATNSLYCAKCHLCSWTSGCISSLVCKNQSLNQLLHQLRCSTGWGEEKNVHQQHISSFLTTQTALPDKSTCTYIQTAEAHLQKGFWGLLSCSRTLWCVKEPLKGTDIRHFEISYVCLNYGIYNSHSHQECSQIAPAKFCSVEMRQTAELIKTPAV